MAFLTILTRSFRRPDQLARCVQSVACQSDPDVEHVIVHDPIGQGVGWSYENLRSVPVGGEYVFILDDDDYLIRGSFVAELKASAESRPDVILFKMDLLDYGILPQTFGEPQNGGIAVSCFAVRRDVWIEHAQDLKAEYAGDFEFIHAVWGCARAHRFGILDVVASRIGQVSHGQPEPGDFAAVGL